jgi:predicted O-methyltransferase YrrM
MMSRLALFRNMLHPRYALVIADKVLSRAAERKHSIGSGAGPWAETEAVDAAAFAVGLSPHLWVEAEAFGRDFSETASAKLAHLEVKLGGGGHYPLLYFLTRLLRPEFVVETGVAAGFSSAAVLTALQMNGTGELWSSDLPYFRLDQPKKFVGYLVDGDLRDGWRLFVDGDRVNLPIIVSELSRIDLLHYDSDKSFRGRKFAMDLLLPLLAPTALVMMDDIQDNGYFQQLVAQRCWNYLVVSFAGKFVGLTGPGLGELGKLAQTDDRP